MIRRLWPEELSSRGGYVLVSALLAAGILFLSGLAVMSRVTTEVRLARRSEEHEKAWQAAMAGIEHCLGYLHADPAGRLALEKASGGTKVCDLTGTIGDVSYEAKAWAANKRQVKIVSSGKSGRAARSLGAIAMTTLTTSGTGLQAWGGGNMTFEGTGLIDGDIFSAQNISVKGFKVCGNLYAHVETETTNVTVGAGCNAGFYDNYPWVEFPDFQVAALKQGAVVIAGNHTPQCPDDKPAARTPDCDGPVAGEKVVLVKGKLTIMPYKLGGTGKTYTRLNYTGRVIYIAEGGVEVSGVTIDLPSTAMLQVIADGVGAEILLGPTGPNDTLRGIYVAPEGKVRTDGFTNLHGMVFAQNWTTNGTLNWTTDPGQGVCTGTGCTGARMQIVKLWEQ